MTTASGMPFDIRAEFPIKEQYVFLNHAAVAPIPLSTQVAISEFARDAAEEGPANYPAWLHSMGLARSAAAQLMQCDAEDVCFVKNTTHGLLIVANSINWKPGDNVVGLAHEFPANIHPWRNLAERGVEFRTVAERPDFTFDPADIAAAMDTRTRLVTVSWVEYSTGFRNDLAALSQLCRERGAMLCVDAIQGLGAFPLDLSLLGIDFLTADGHKWLLAPEGCGILYVRRERIGELNHSMCGWCGLRNPQEYDNYDQLQKPTAKRFEEGSHNLMAITALGASIRLLLDAGPAFVAARVEALATCLMDQVRTKGYEIITPRGPTKHAGIVAFSKAGVDPAETMRSLLAQHRISIAARRGWLRASPHFYNDEDEIARLVAVLP